MAISTVEPSSALIVVDLQVGTLVNPHLIDASRVVRNADRLSQAFRAAGRPVVLVAFDPDQAPPGRSELGRRIEAAPEFTDHPPGLTSAPEDIRIVKGGWSAFSHPGLKQKLVDLRVSQVFVVGVATTFGVESTARDAYDAGFHVVVVRDAVTDMSDEAQAQAFARVFPVLGETTTTAEVIEAMSGEK